VPNLDQRIDGVKAALEGTGVNVVVGGQQTTCDPKIGAAVTEDLLTKYPTSRRSTPRATPRPSAPPLSQAEEPPLKIYGYDGDPEMSKLILAGRYDGHDGAVAVSR